MDKRMIYDEDTPTPPPYFLCSNYAEPRSHAGGRPSRSAKRLRVVLIEDDLKDVQRLRDSLAATSRPPIELRHAESLTRGIDLLRGGGIDLVLLDLSLPESWGLDTLSRVQAAAPATPIVVLTNLNDDSTALRAVQQGAQDYLIKGQVTGDLLIRSMRYAIERGRRRQAERELRSTQEEFRIAHEIQQRLFPASPPTIAGVDIGGASIPAEATGGDCFDYIPMLGGCYGLMVADVAGHGFGPALLMAEVRAYLRALAWSHSDPGEILRSANRLLIDDVAAEHFVTLFFGQLDPRTRQFRYASAGHPEAYILDASGRVKQQLASTGLPLGLERTATFAARSPLRLERGDMVLLLTDGVFEARSPVDEPYGIERFLQNVRDNRHRPARHIVESTYESIRRFCAGQRPADDITAIVIKVLTG